MADLLPCPPPPDVLPTILAIPGVAVQPTILASQQGPDGNLGPEAAGAILMLQATFNDADKAHDFWVVAAEIMALLADAPGFIRRYNFADGVHMTLIAFWRTLDDAKAFAARPEHRAAMGQLFRNRWQYSHFAALWETASNHGRQIFCQVCDGVSEATEGACHKCGTAFEDPYMSLSVSR
jgi:heme-degrading monooxygenase HmoA